MNTWKFAFCPQAPDWKLDWSAIEWAFAELPALVGVPQDVIWHAEGDVQTHTRMVADAMRTDPQWRALEEPQRHILFVAALLHDIGKRMTTRIQDGRVSAPGHTVVGQRMARRLLWEGDNVPSPDFQVREAITALVRYHGLPLMFIERSEPERSVIAASQTVRCDHLAMLARADVLGRICPDASGMLDRISLFTELCAEQDCLETPKAFASEQHRFHYFNAGSDYHYVPYDDSHCEVTLMSGLPAAGKDYWVTHNAGDLPVISLDDLREKMDVDPAAAQGPVINAAKDGAKEYLRKGQPFIWNATNLSRDLRQQLISLFANYKARVRVVYLECSPLTLQRRNSARPRPVPAKVVNRMIAKLEVPTITESHELVIEQN